MEDRRRPPLSQAQFVAGLCVGWIDGRESRTGPERSLYERSPPFFNSIISCDVRLRWRFGQDRWTPAGPGEGILLPPHRRHTVEILDRGSIRWVDLRLRLHGLPSEEWLDLPLRPKSGGTFWVLPTPSISRAISAPRWA